MAGLNIPAEVIRQQIASGVDVIIQIDRYPDGTRKVSHITEVIGLDSEGNVEIQNLFTYEFQTVNQLTQRCEGYFSGNGIIPKIHQKFTQLGLQIPDSIYQLVES